MEGEGGSQGKEEEGNGKEVDLSVAVVHKYFEWSKEKQDSSEEAEPRIQSPPKVLTHQKDSRGEEKHIEEDCHNSVNEDVS